MTVEEKTHVQRCLDRWNANDPTALNELVLLVQDRLLGMARQMLHTSRLRRWEQSSDLVQEVYTRLLRGFQRYRFATPERFFALAGKIMRRRLLDLCRRYFGPCGLGTHHYTPPADRDRQDVAASAVFDPALLREFADFHEAVQQLPDDLRLVVDLHYYYGMTHQEIADLTHKSLSTVKRSWAEARLVLQERLRPLPTRVDAVG